ncbi:hypothetical protein A4X03_0g1452 [Tilletia caries]|uniref:Uncharacterized protein n=1 Tax=Tilletia caries TaxID=13290 RepID=A0A177UN44_9BASI|nr:hypothetical protein CF335_g6142 [Tilletia laevis]KAE8263755.1 hypothetical protein A4X03_0g1452 [Tilletia caries]
MGDQFSDLIRQQRMSSSRGMGGSSSKRTRSAVYFEFRALQREEPGQYTVDEIREPVTGSSGSSDDDDGNGGSGGDGNRSGDSGSSRGNDSSGSR